ncbi:MAG: hypothetical protein ACK5Y6_08520 [Pseudomonadota bacterium]|jgi:hypothetical protein
MQNELGHDSSWETALKLSHSAIKPPSALTRLVRNSWTGKTSLRDFSQTLRSARVNDGPIIDAAQILSPSVTDGESAISTLGFKGASSVAAIHFAASCVICRCAHERLRELISQRIADSIEIGYHFGISASSIGPESGMLLGFAQNIGCAILVTSEQISFSDGRAMLEDELPAESFLSRFNCEPYQVSSLALQRLGYGPELATAAVTALGGLSLNLNQHSQLTRDWCAASDWIASLMIGDTRPKRRQTAEHFAELLSDPDEGDCPVHIQALRTSVEDVRTEHSTWRWHTLARESNPSINEAAA